MKLFRWLVLVPLVALVAWFLLSGELSTDDAAPEPPASETLAAEQSPALAEPRNELLAAPSDSSERSVNATNADSALVDPLTLLVVDGANGRPIAGAEVFSFDRDDDWEASRVLHDREAGEFEAWLELHGRRTETDARGEARVPRSKGDAIVVARHAGRFAMQDYVAGVERVVIAFGDEHEFEVHVTNRSGADVAGIDVVVRSLDAFGLRLRAHTDGRGVAHFRHVRPFQRADVPEPCEVSVAALLNKRPKQRFDALMEIPQRVELVLPPCGAVDVTVVDEAGVAVAGTFGFHAELVTDDFEARNLSLVVQSARPGTFRFEPVEVGARFEVDAWLDRSRSRAKGTLDGPTRDGESVAATLTLRALPAALFRAVDERGAVLAKQTLRLSVRDMEIEWSGDEPWGYPDVVTDDVGRFRVPYRTINRDPDYEPRRTVELFTTRASDGVELYFRTEFDMEPPSEDRDNGDAQFLPAKRLVAGRVLDPLGAPVAGVLVRLYVPFTVESKRDEDALRHPAWIVSDANGVFEARGVLDVPRIRVIANAGTPCASAMTEVPLGASDVVLTVLQQGALEGTILLPEGVIAEELHCRWSTAGEVRGDKAAQHTQVTAAPEPGLARFHFDELPAGRGELAVMLGSHAAVRIADVEIAPGAPTHDPRVQRIDLRSSVRVLDVRVEQPDGSPASNGVVQTHPTGSSESQSMWQIQRGTARCLVGIAPVDLWVGVVGARRERVANVAANSWTVRMRRPYELELTFRAPNLPGDLLATLDTPGEPGLLCNVSSRVAEGAVMRLQPAAAGRWRVRLTTQRNSAAGRELRTLGEWSLELADVDELQPFAFDVAPEALEAALR